MIELYSGTPGSGKSLHMAKEIRSRLKRRDGYIIGNFFVNTDVIKGCKGTYLLKMNDELTPDFLLQFSRNLSQELGRRLKEGEILLIIDEAQLLFNAREWQNISRNGWLSFFSQHRHYGYDIILAAQFDRMLDRQVRCLLEYETVHRKVSRFGVPGLILGFLTKGQLYVTVQKWYPIKEKITSEMFIGNVRLFAIYDSYNHFDAPGQGKSMSGDKGAPTITITLPGADKKAQEEAQEETAEDLAMFSPSIKIAAPEEPAEEVDEDIEFLDLSQT